MKNFLYLIVLAALLAAGAVAQSKAVKRPSFPQQRTSESVDPGDVNPAVIDMKGLQTFPGTWDEPNNIFRNNTFAVVGSKKQVSVNLSISLDHSEFASPENVSQVINGIWSAAVYSDGEYLGTLYGNVLDGTIDTVVDGDSGEMIERTVNVRILITGGMDGYESNWGTFGPKAYLKLVTDSSGSYTVSCLEGIF